MSLKKPNNLFKTSVCPQDLLEQWKTQGGRVQDLSRNSGELESLIISITTPTSKTGNSPSNHILPLTQSTNQSLSLQSTKPITDSHAIFQNNSRPFLV